MRAPFRTGDRAAEVFWAPPGGTFAAERRVQSAIVPHCELRTYEVDLAAHPRYRGRIGQLRFDPVVEQAAGDVVELVSIGWQR